MGKVEEQTKFVKKTNKTFVSARETNKQNLFGRKVGKYTYILSSNIVLIILLTWPPAVRMMRPFL